MTEEGYVRIRRKRGGSEISDRRGAMYQSEGREDIKNARILRENSYERKEVKIASKR